MKILEILPLNRPGKHQLYNVVYEEFYKTLYFEGREREIVRHFKIDKAEFKRHLLDSMSRENDQENDDI